MVFDCGLRSARRLLAAGFLLLGVFAVHAAVPRLRGVWSGFFEDGVYYGLLVLAVVVLLWRALGSGRDRWAWRLVALGSGFWLLGDLYYLVEPTVSLGIADAGYLAFYPCLYGGLMLLVRERIRGLDRSVWLDGVASGLAAGAACAAVVFEPVRAATGGSVVTIAINLAYPAGDAILLAAVAGVLAISGARPGRTWLWLGASLGVLAIADSVFLIQSANGSYSDGGLLNALWPAGMLLLASAAWQREERRRDWRLGSASAVAGPLLGSLVGGGVLLAGVFGRAGALAEGLAFAALATSVVRGTLTIQDNRRLLAVREQEALTDPLTGLGNRRRLLADLEDVLAQAGGERLLGIFDLDGFKQYNDTYGHPAGDIALRDMATRLALLAGSGAYRLGGDEFCVLLETSETAASLDQLAAALCFEHEGHRIRASRGGCLFPREATTASEALQLVDTRLYRDKAAQTAAHQDPMPPQLSETALREVLSAAAETAKAEAA